jgi:Putative transposase
LEEAAGEENGLRGKPLCASLAGFSLHAAQFAPAHDREALERLLRYGLRAPFAQERLSQRPDGKVLYKLRRPWPNAQGNTHLVLEPLDFLRRLAALISFPYAHQVRYHGVFANRSAWRRLLPSPPPRVFAGMEAGTVAPGEAGSAAVLAPASAAAAVEGTTVTTRSPRRVPWAQLLRRVLQVDALRCPRCSSLIETVPMTVLALITDLEVVGRILNHLGLPACAPPLSPARQKSEPLGFELGEEDSEAGRGTEETEAQYGAGAIRPPP